MTDLEMSFGIWTFLAVLLTAISRLSFESKFDLGLNIFAMSIAWGIVASLFATILLR
jgi:hypothetical protein